LSDDVGAPAPATEIPSATDPLPEEPDTWTRVPPWAWWSLGLSLFLSAVVLTGFLIHVPYTTISPGDAVALADKVHIDGVQTFATPRGDIRLLFIRERVHVNLWRYLQARLDSNVDIEKDTAVNPLRLSPTQQNDLARQQMADAKNAATKVALEAAGFKVTQAPGLVVTDFVHDKPGEVLPAEKALKLGDVILTADGHTITKTAELSDAIEKHTPGEHVTLGIERDGKRQTVEVGVAALGDRRVIGVYASPRFRFPVKVDVDTSGIGGPSAGLAMTLAIFDDLTPGDLTGGKPVAVTGTIEPDGEVGEIGGIRQKAVAVRAHAQLFIVPKCASNDPPAQLAACQKDLEAVIDRVGKKVRVVPVATFREALAALREAGGDPVTVATTSTSVG
jgi:PDZ domain-containing protein